MFSFFLSTSGLAVLAALDSSILFSLSSAVPVHVDRPRLGSARRGPRRFFLTLAAVRMVRFGGEAVLALFYGDAIVAWLKSETVRTIAGALFVLLLASAAISSYRLIRSTSQRSRGSVRA